MRVPYGTLRDELLRVLREAGFEPARALAAAELFAGASRDGVSSHGLNRFPAFIESVHRGVVDVHAVPQQVDAFGCLERWDGQRGAGNLNAQRCMGRAIELAREGGIGCVALRNTNHWMRGGSYGWQAAEAGVIGMCWTNTTPNLPPWGAVDARVGNNPLVIAIPRADEPIVLDMAMSMFAYGKLASYRSSEQLLPVDGGYDREGQLTRDPAEIEATGRPLPIGFWKGSGLALVLDLVAALLSGGNATHQVQRDDAGVSQVFLAIDPQSLAATGSQVDIVEDAIAHLHAATPTDPERPVTYPGERSLQTRRDSMALGVPVDPAIWGRVKAMKG